MVKIHKRTKQVLTIVIVLGTFIFFGFYLKGHPQLFDTLLSLNPLILILLTAGYVLVTLINSFILYYSLKFIGKKTPIFDNFALTGYSSIVNFFGPLQSGPGFRAVYLKKKYNVRFKDFFITTLVFYGFFAAINTAIIGIAIVYTFHSNLLLLAALLLVAIAVVFFVLRIPRVKSLLTATRIHDRNFWLIGLGALFLTLTTAAIYFIELLHVNTGVAPLQALIYTAAANLALFVSLTPGAIGFRESFLLLSQQLHGIHTSVIVGASVIDRAFYVCFLCILFVVLLAINNRKHLAIFKLKS